MKKFKKLLSVMALGVLLITNVVPVCAAEKDQSAKIESLSELDLEAYTQGEVRGDLRTDKLEMLSAINKLLGLPEDEKLLFIVGRRLPPFQQFQNCG